MLPTERTLINKHWFIKIDDHDQEMYFSLLRVRMKETHINSLSLDYDNF